MERRSSVDPEPFRTGLFAVAVRQAIRMSILDADARGVINPCVRLLDAAGKVLLESEARRTRVETGRTA